MLNKRFKSIFKNELELFIKYKKSIGYKYEQQIFRLRKIDKILYLSKIEKKEITKELFEELIKTNKAYGINAALQLSVVRDFCKFLDNVKKYKNIYYDDRKIKYINNYMPVIFTRKEIDKLFLTMDLFAKKCKNTNKKLYKLYYTYSIALRLVYADGLRISEALSIKYNDIDFEKNTIVIAHSKQYVTRYVLLSESMSKCLKNYLKVFKIENDLIFTNSNASKIRETEISNYYKRILAAANLNPDAHIHDLRHCFCNDAFEQMINKGYAEDVVLVYLAKFMGHKSVKETEHYIHLTNYKFKKIVEANNTVIKQLCERDEIQ